MQTLVTRIAALFLSMALFFSMKEVSAQVVDTSYYYRINNAAQGDGKSLTLSGDDNGHFFLLMRPSLEHAMQYWKVIATGNGNYRLINQHYGKEISMEVVNDESKKKVSAAVNKNVASQFWRISTNPDGTKRITCLWLGTGNALDILNDGKNYNELMMGETGSVPTQSWKFTKIPKVIVVLPLPKQVDGIDASSVYRLTCLWQGDAKSLSLNESTPLLKATSSSLEQCWKFVLNPNGYYRMINQQFPDKAMDVINDGTNNNRLTLNTIGDYSGQYWKLTPAGDGSYRITSLWQGEAKSLDVLNDGTNNNELILNSTGNYSGQFWKITKTSVPSLQSSPPMISQPSPISTKPVTKTKSKLMAGEELLADMKLISANGQYTLIQQKDGNLVVYNGSNKPIWASNTNGKSVKRCVMQKDGNLVQYLSYPVAVWASNTNGNEDAYLVMQDDGNLVIYNKENQPIWTTNSNGR